ncbi:hypothetical protein M422DRAFT_264213 [Sphaerobolus stellatus SS14]|uniref:Unplaced genomic scaffold SPHSTscaffold_133, whole genome shotgun sequence n=1 Tax=Sphaerobolus stellatus (strain SS14) TaxID=990650 RepID=A0A0C9V8I8_SPHS4|nr:hypothetical protein M422DRAFT_264213 [Sphaerobolus stellatus SS14]
MSRNSYSDDIKSAENLRYISPIIINGQFSFILLTAIRLAVAFPVFDSLAGISKKDISEFVSKNSVANIPDPSGPLADSSLILVNDTAYPFIQARPGGLNLGNDFTKFLVYQARLMNGNPLTNLLVFTSPRILSAYSEAVFPTFSVNGRLNSRQLTIDAARSFLDPQMMPNDFYGQPALVNFSTVEPLVKEIFNKHPFTPGVNKGTNNFVLMSNAPALGDFAEYTKILLHALFPSNIPTPRMHSGPLLTRTRISCSKLLC